MAWTDYAPRFLGPTYLERARSNPLRLRVYRGQNHVVPTSGTFSLYDTADTAVVNGSAVVIDADGYATITVAAATLTSYAFGAGWRVEWSLVMPDTYTHLFRNGAALVRVRCPPAATEADILRLHPNLREHLPAGQTDWQDQLDVAWEFGVVGKLEGMGRRPYLVVSESSLVAPHTYEALAVIGGALNAGGDPDSAWGRFEAKYRDMALSAWGNCTFEYDEEDTGQADPSKRSAANPTVWLAGGSEDWGDTWPQ